MIFRMGRPGLRLAVGLGAAMWLAAGHDGSAQETAKSRGRKYKPPPETSHIEVTVTKGYNHKPISNAAVIFHELRPDGKDQGNLELKTDPDGKAVIDVIPIGTNLRVQVLAPGFATFAEDFQISETSRQIPVEMIRPREQVSTYVDNSGKSSQLKPGVQEPIRPKVAGKDNAASKSVKVPATTKPAEAPPLPPSAQDRPSPVANPAPAASPNR